MKITKKEVVRFLLDNVDKKFYFYNGTPDDKEGCVLCEFFKSKGLTDFVIGGTYYRVNKSLPISMPKWFRNANPHGTLTGKEVLLKIIDYSNRGI